MTKEQIITKIKEEALVAVVRAKDADEAKKITDACIAGGCASVEITFTVPGAHEIIRELSSFSSARAPCWTLRPLGSPF